MTDPSYATRQKRLLALLCSISMVFILAATLWPFDFFPPNGVSWARGESGIQFANAGYVVSKAPLRVAGTDANHSCSLEIFFRPAGSESLRTILSIYAAHNPRQFLVRQWDDGLLVSHDFLDPPNRSKTARFTVDQTFQPGKLLLVTMTFSPRGTVVYIDGGQSQAFSGFTISQSDFAGQIVIGISADRYDPWRGELRGLAIYAKELTATEVFRHYKEWTEGRGFDSSGLDGAITRYDFTEGAGSNVHNAAVSGPDLEIPNRFEVPHKHFLQSPAKHFAAKWWYLRDVLLNIAGFVPLGFVLCAYWGWTRNRQQAIVYAVLAGGALSFLIEVLQGYIPQRDSGMTDVITNALGAALGAVLARSGMVSRSFPNDGGPAAMRGPGYPPAKKVRGGRAKARRYARD